MERINRILLGGVFLLLLLLFFFFIFQKVKSNSSTVKVESPGLTFSGLLSKLDFYRKKEIKIDGYHYKHLVLFGQNPFIIARQLAEGLNKLNIKFEEMTYLRTYYFRLLRPYGKFSVIVVKKYWRTPVLALLIDDVGDKWRLLKKLVVLKEPLSLAIFPFEVFSRRSAVFLRKYGFQLLLHLPLEPLHYRDPRVIKGLIYTRMSVNDMRKIINRALENLGNISGVNNHIGSKFTSDPIAMEKLLTILREKSLFFVDSFTISKSVGWRVAFKMSVPTAKRDVFIDNSLDTNKIEKMWNEAVKKAVRYGKVLVIGHLHPQTIKVILKELPLLKSKGVLPVYVSDLLF